MALGKAIVAPRQENIEEVVREGREAVFFTPESVESLGEELRSLVQDRRRQEELGRRARGAIDERGFLWAENARRVVVMVNAWAAI
jgi:glycosyltransferase involved in cell wall biosynthesis